MNGNLREQLSSHGTRAHLPNILIRVVLTRSLESYHYSSDRRKTAKLGTLISPDNHE